MNIQKIFDKGKVANVHKMMDFGTCDCCGRQIIVEDDEVGFCGTEFEWNDYFEQYSGYLDLEDELEVISESDTEIEANNYYDDLRPEEAEFILFEVKFGREICRVFCSEECQSKYEESLFN